MDVKTLQLRLEITKGMSVRDIARHVRQTAT